MGPNAPAIPPAIVYIVVAISLLMVLGPIVAIVFGLTAPTKQDHESKTNSETGLAGGRSKYQFGVTAMLIIMTFAALVAVIAIKVRQGSPVAPVVRELNLDAKRR